MAAAKKSGKEELAREVFVALVAKWDIHDRAGAKILSKHCLEIADGFYDSMDSALASKKPEKLT